MSDLILRAEKFCRERHAGQLRDDGREYWIHPFTVADILREQGCVDEEMLATALLHDTLEDTATTEAELRQVFGARVAGYVAALTHHKRPGEPSSVRMRHMAEDMRQAPLEVKQIKLADRFHNISDMTGAWQRDKILRYIKVTRELLEAIGPEPLPDLQARIRARLDTVEKKPNSENAF